MKKHLFFVLIGGISVAAVSMNTLATRAAFTNSGSAVTTMNGTISTLSIHKDAFKMLANGHTVEVVLGKSFSTGAVTLTQGDVVSVTGISTAPHYANDSVQLKAKILTDNGTQINLHPVSSISTYSAVAITAVSTIKDSIRISMGSKVVEIHLGNSFLNVHPLTVNDKITVVGEETVGLFADSPTHLHPTSITINGTTYNHFGK